MDYFLILSGDHLYQMDYNKFVDFHRETGADVTVAVKPVGADQASDFGILKTDRYDRITDFSEKPPVNELMGLESQTDIDKPYLASMGIYVFNRGVLVRLLTGEKGHDFGKHIIPYAIKHLNVKAYKFNGYWEDIGTIKSFFHANLALTDQFSAFDLYRRDHPIFTRPRYLPASKIIGCRINNSIICEGGIIEESVIERSVIGIRSKISPGVHLKNVIMMGADGYQSLQEIDEDRMAGSPTVGIGKNTIIENAIIDKNARIGDNVTLINKDHVTEDVAQNFEVREGIIVVYKNAIIPSGTTF